MGLLPDTYNCGLRMRRECRGSFPRHLLHKKPLVSDPDMHHGTCITHVPWCMSGSLTHDGGENVPGIPGACATRNFTYPARGPWARRSTVLRVNNIAVSQGLTGTYKCSRGPWCLSRNYFKWTCPMLIRIWESYYDGLYLLSNRSV